MSETRYDLIWCSRCKQHKARSEFSRNARRSNGLASYCKDCHRQYGRVWAKRNGEKRLESNRAWRKKNPEWVRQWAKIQQERHPAAFRARLAVNGAVRTGRLKKPEACQGCGVIAAAEALHAHHHLGYKQENWLKVEWFCVPCHKAAHKEAVVV